MVSAYIVRRTPAGTDRMEEFLEEDMVAIGWSTLGDLSEANKQEIRNRIEDEYPDDDFRANGLRVGYINRLVNKMDEGDTVLVPRYGNVYVGEVAGRYEYKESLSADYAHQRSIDWRFNKSAIDGQKAPQKIHKKLYPGTKSHTVQDLDDKKAVETFLKQSAGAKKRGTLNSSKMANSMESIRRPLKRPCSPFSSSTILRCATLEREEIRKGTPI